MTKTMTLAKAYEILATTEITEIDETVISEELKNLPIPALHVYEQYMRAGQDRIHTYCHKCKRHMDILGHFLAVPCNCGNTNRISVHGEYHNGTKVYILRVDEDERYFVFLILDDQLYLDMPNNLRSNNTFDWLKSPIRHKSYNREIGMFLEGKGFLFVDSFKNKVGRRSTRQFSLEDLFNRTQILNEDVPSSFTNGIPVKEFCKTHSSSANCSKGTKEVDYSKYTKMRLKEISFDDFEIPLLWRATNKTSAYSEGYLYCPKCKTVSKITTSSLPSLICPKCKTQHRVSYEPGEIVTEKSYVDVMPETNDLVIRTFSFRTKLGIDGQLTINAKEDQRVILSPKSIVGVNMDTNQKIPVSKLGSRWGFLTHVENEAFLVELLKRTSVASSGLVEFLGKNKRCTFGAIVDYIFAWQKVPQVEQLVKCGMYRAAQHIIDAPTTYIRDYGRSKATNPKDFLKISNPVFKTSREHDLPMHTIYSFQEMWETDNSVDYDIFEAVSYLGLGQAITIHENYHIPYRRILQYLEDVENHQCCPPRESFPLWADYLKMASDMNYDLTRASVKYPSSLKKEHDIATYAYTAVVDQIHEKESAERANQNDKYAFADGDYIIKIPHSQKDLVEESKKLLHCVKCYIDSVRKGNTTIVL